MDKTQTIQELREQRAKLIQNAKLIIEAADERDLTEEEQAQFDSMMAQADQLEEEVDTAERKQRLFNAENNLRKSSRAVPAVVRTSEKETRSLFPEVVRQWLTYGTKAHCPTPDVFRAADNMGVNFGSNYLTIDLRTQTKTNNVGGYTVPQDFGDKIVEHLKYFCPIRNYATVIQTANGQALPFPTNDDSSNLASIIGEASEVTETDTSFDQKTLGAYNYKTMVRLSLELLQDSKFNLEDYLSRMLAMRIGRKQEADFIIGNGSSKPTGLVYSASSGVTSWTTTFANLVSLFYGVDPAYRAKGVWMMHDTVAAAIRSLADDQNRPLWNLNNPFQEGQVETLFGRPVVISNSMDASGLSKKVIAFGDPTDFYIRDVGEVTLMKSEHRYIEYGLVAFVAFLRSDSNWLGSSRALKAGITAAS